MQNPSGIHWQSISKYVDTSTGEELTKHQAHSKTWIREGIDKKVIINENKTHGTIYYTHKLRPSPQSKLSFD